MPLPQRPFSLAAVCGAGATLNMMLGSPINVCLSDPNGNNVLHELVRFASVSKKCEVVMAETYSILMRLLPTTEFERLLRAENNDRLRPLELAAKLSTLRMGNVIVQTPGIYLAKVERDGPLIRKWYDLTEYESYAPGNRRDVSPITFLLDLHKSDLYSDECLTLLSQAPIRHWIDTKLRISLPFIFTWFLLRLVYLIVFIFCENSDFVHMKINKKMGCTGAMFKMPKWAGTVTTVYLFVHSILILMFDVFEAVSFLLHNGRWRRWRTESIISGRAASQFLPIMSACFRIHGDASCYSPIILDIQVRFPGRANANRHLPGDAVDDAVLRPDGTISRLFHRLDTEDVPGSIELYGRVRHPIDAALLHAAHDGQRLQRTGMHRAIQQSTALGIHVIHRHPQHGRLYVVSSTQSSVLLPAPRRLCLQHILPAHQLPHCADEQLRQPDQRAQVRHHVDAASLGRHADGESRRTTVEALLHSTSTNVLRVLRSPCVCNRSLHLLRHARISSDDQAAASTGSGVVTHAISPLIH